MSGSHHLRRPQPPFHRSKELQDLRYAAAQDNDASLAAERGGRCCQAACARRRSRGELRTYNRDDGIVTCVGRLSQQAGAQRATAITAAEASRAPRNGDLRANGSKVKLPKLELQRFSGAATECQPCWEQYQQAIHDNDALSDGEKFLYLQSALSGRAAAAVAGIQATAANYNTVIELLKERFGRTDVLIQEQLTQLLDLPTVRRGHEARIPKGRIEGRCLNDSSGNPHLLLELPPETIEGALQHGVHNWRNQALEPRERLHLRLCRNARQFQDTQAACSMWVVNHEVGE
ncbi:hypothetical protein MTO96_051818 [Rhipicephalus appendiculatus]